MLKDKLDSVSDKGRYAIGLINILFSEKDKRDGVIICRIDDVIKNPGINISGTIMSVIQSKSNWYARNDLKERLSRECQESIGDDIITVGKLLSFNQIAIEPISIQDVLDMFIEPYDDSHIPKKVKQIRGVPYEISTHHDSSDYIFVVKKKNIKASVSYNLKEVIKSEKDLVATLSDPDIIKFLNGGKNINFSCDDMSTIEKIFDATKKPGSAIFNKINSMHVKIEKQSRGWVSDELKIVCPRLTRMKKNKAQHFNDNVGIFYKEGYYIPYTEKLCNDITRVFRTLMRERFGIYIEWPNRGNRCSTALSMFSTWVKLGLSKYTDKSDVKKINKYIKMIKADLSVIKKEKRRIIYSKLDARPSVPGVVPQADYLTKDFFKTFRVK